MFSSSSFGAVQQEVSAPAPDAGAKKPRQEERQTCLPVTVRAIERAVEQRSDTGGELRFHGSEPGVLLLVGLVEAMTRQSASIELSLNDGTGRIKARHYVSDRSGDLDALAVGRYVNVFGSVRTAPEVHFAVAGMGLVQSADEVSYHMIEAAYAALKLQKGHTEPPTPAPKKQVLAEAVLSPPKLDAAVAGAGEAGALGKDCPSALPESSRHRTDLNIPYQLGLPWVPLWMIALRAAVVLPLAQARCQSCTLATGSPEAELSLVQLKSEVLRRSPSFSSRWTGGVGRQSRAARAPGFAETRSSTGSPANSSRPPRPPSPHLPVQQSDFEVPKPLTVADLSLPAALETAARMVAGPAAGGSTGGNGSTDGNSGLGILVILLIAIVVVSCLVYLVLTHNSKGANDRGAFDRLSTAPPAKSVARDSTGPRPFASPEPSRLTLEDRNSLPMIYPDLVMNNAHTRLAIPAEPLLEKEFEIDILGLRCVPLLTATLNSRGGRRVVQIALHSVGTLLAKVTSGMQVLGADGAHFGTLSKDTKDSKEEQYLLRAPGGRVILTIRCDPDVNEVQMVSAYAGRTTERAMVVRRPAGNLPAEHYEVTVSPQVDAVLVLACFLGLKVFGMPRGSQAEVMRSGSLFG